ncbi:MAG: PstS family phosphate ABC transporter substrate-binding protein [Prevotella sp.]
MNKTASYFFVGVSLLTITLAACSGNKKSKDGRTDTNSSGTISFVSDESFSPIVDEEKGVFEMMHPDAHLKPIYTNESDGINELLKGKCWLVFTARALKPSEIESLKSQNFLPQCLKVAYDALALIVNKQNTDSVISVDDFKNILSGKVTRWSDIYKGSSRGDITLVFDNPKSSTVHYCEDSLLGGKPIKAANAIAVKKTADVISYVEKNPGAIGIIGNNWLNDKRDTTNLTFKKNIKVMSVSKIHPATATSGRKPYQYYIWNGEYPLVRTIYAILNDPRRGLPSGFAHFVQSPKGQLIIMKSGLLPVYGNINIRDVNVNSDN